MSADKKVIRELVDNLNGRVINHEVEDGVAVVKLTASELFILISYIRQVWEVHPDLM